VPDSKASHEVLPRLKFHRGPSGGQSGLAISRPDFIAEILPTGNHVALSALAAWHQQKEKRRPARWGVLWRCEAVAELDARLPLRLPEGVHELAQSVDKLGAANTLIVFARSSLEDGSPTEDGEATITYNIHILHTNTEPLTPRARIPQPPSRLRGRRNSSALFFNFVEL
jgi:hypothetical protein